MSAAVTTGYYCHKLTEDNFVEGLYVIDVNMNIFITTVWEDQKLLLDLNCGVLDYFSYNSFCVWIIENEGLVKIKIANPIKRVY